MLDYKQACDALGKYDPNNKNCLYCALCSINQGGSACKCDKAILP